jgi:hypothetical protein
MAIAMTVNWRDSLKRLLLAIVCVSGAAMANAQINLDPGTGLIQFTTNVNDGYASGRGMVFTMNSTIQVSSFGFYTSGNTGPTTWTLHQVTNLSGNVLVGATLLATVVDTMSAGALGYYDTPTFTPVTLTAGNSYHLNLAYTQAAATNHFYNWNGPSVNIGVMTLIDGTFAGDTGNTVAPGFRINGVPEPASMAALALGAGLLARRRRRA